MRKPSSLSFLEDTDHLKKRELVMYMVMTQREKNRIYFKVKIDGISSAWTSTGNSSITKTRGGILKKKYYLLKHLTIILSFHNSFPSY